MRGGFTADIGYLFVLALIGSVGLGMVGFWWTLGILGVFIGVNMFFADRDMKERVHKDAKFWAEHLKRSRSRNDER